MPAHSSHLLQPLDVGCFLPLKRAYGDEISGLAWYSSKQIKKEAFLPAFKAAFKRLIMKENICAGFRGAGLVLHNLEAVILKLDVVLSESLTVGEVANLIAKREGSGQQGGREPAKKVRTQRRCGRCGETSHNTRTCAVEIVNASNNNKSK
ncbi:uncharacterized protein M421DRAFT_427236 [Didymella exigua CBS 183.55]|uniref:DDE-1 domain-containing protein n=1 Tax=Didymella exigua CBS 183.55 TaxID=1150837 RepID=A0A6A5R405_9PLEO|nr:uncharacterized protein M421DRAFT_427236 [Didymella exigua CBS 183.55]KAF1922119.1 hypothetical protein M421DRAFT_427236 [Didymella exigua CBS 183.55]